MPRMTADEARSYWDLSPKVRRAIAARSGHFRNDYEESLRISRACERVADTERYHAEIGPALLDLPVAA